MDPCAVEVGCGDAARVAFAAGNVLGYALMRPGRVVVRLVLGQDGPQTLSVPNTSSVAVDQLTGGP